MFTMLYKLKKDFRTPCFTIYAGVIKTENEWCNIFAKMQKGDCDIKTDWFEKMDYSEIFTKNDMISFGNHICKKSVSKLIGGADYFDEWMSNRYGS